MGTFIIAIFQKKLKHFLIIKYVNIGFIKSYLELKILNYISKMRRRDIFCVGGISEENLTILVYLLSYIRS